MESLLAHSEIMPMLGHHCTGERISILGFYHLRLSMSLWTPQSIVVAAQMPLQRRTPVCASNTIVLVSTRVGSR